MVSPMGIEQSDGEKLIRHLMPAFIAKRDGRKMTTRVVEGEEHVVFLKKKIAEEADELAAASSETFAEELGDVRQALSDFCVVVGIKPLQLRPRAVGALPAAQDERIRLFRGHVARLADLAGSVPDDEADRADHVSAMLESIAAVTEIAGIREAVRAQMAAKLREKGDFAHGIVWRMVKP